MSVIVRGMEMPVMCSYCDFTYYGQGDNYACWYCSITDKEIDYITRHPDCPLEEADDGWIPCSKRLPEEDDYNSCIECPDGAVWYITENGTMGIGYYYESTKEWSTTDDLKTDGKVVAWRPLSPAFRPKEDN